MANETSSVQITKEPVWVNEELIIVPMQPNTIQVEEEEFNYDNLQPYIPGVYPDFNRLKSDERDLLINIETTGLKPYDSRIISIAWLDLNDPNDDIKVITGDDEEDLINTFFDVFEQGNFTRIVGWNVSFDYRFIWGIASLYRRQIPRWIKIKLRDVQQIYQQVKEEYVYGYQSPDKQENWSKFLFGRGKYSPQEEVLKRYLIGDFNFVSAFNIQQIENLRNLYDLARFTSAESSILRNKPIFKTNPSVLLSDEQTSNTSTGKRQCSICLSEQDISNTECSVCGNKL